MNERTKNIRDHFDKLSADIGSWRRRYRYYHNDQASYLRYLVPEGKRVLELGCGTGDLLHALKPSYGVGVDLSPGMVKTAQSKYPHLIFITGDANHPEQLSQMTFDYVILSDLVGYLDDIESCLEGLHRFCEPHTRIIISFYNFLWEPVLTAAECLKLKTPTPQHSWLTPNDMRNLLLLADYQVVKTEQRLLFPVYVPLVTWLLNHIGTLPVINRACLCHYVVARALFRKQRDDFSVSIVIPCRNEKGNIESAIQRIPRFGKYQEIIFVDGHSTDGTQDEIRRVMAAHVDRDIKLLVQKRSGKGEAVREGFKDAMGDILMILDADLTVPPEDLPKFYRALASGKAEFLNGCRLVYPMEGEAMRLLNLIANKLFAMAFTWLLGERLKDTLCGTKVLFRKDYEALTQNRSYFGDFDPFGDFDLLFGASKLNLKIIEVPVRYRRRLYGETQISRFRHGLLLFRMVIFALRKIKWF
jgi:ubiquinone/menaquinone biosynthesis C-methylase UbiE